tara:strand:+ start:1802 stop:1957 length:156 start_codon:yes stop_codon:yes gene_type:complete
MHWILSEISHELFYKLVDDGNGLLLIFGLVTRNLRDRSLESFNASGSMIGI